MAEFVYFQDSPKEGKLGISQRVFDQLVANAISNIPGISQSGKQLKKNQKVRLNRPVQTTIKRGIVNIWVAIDVKKGVNVEETKSKIHEEIFLALIESTEQIPFNIQIKVEEVE